MKRMSVKKFELTSEYITWGGRKLFRIKALIDFGNVKAGELGGYVEKEENLSHDGNAWVCGNAKVCGNAEVCGNAKVYDNAEVYGDAWVYDNAEVYGDAWVYDNAEVCGDAKVCGDAEVCGDADYTTIKGFGSCSRTTTFFRGKDEKIYVRCGCFYGDMESFRKKVKETHGDSKYAKEYLMIADLMEIHFEEDKLI